MYSSHDSHEMMPRFFGCFSSREKSSIRSNQEMMMMMMMMTDLLVTHTRSSDGLI